LPKEEHMLYELVWNLTLASQAKPAVYRTVTVYAGSEDSPKALKAAGKRLLFEGWKRFVGDGEEKEIGQYRKGQILTGKLFIDKSFTTPPPRYDDGSFIKALESNGVGRPSTYAAIQSTLFKRNYVRKEKGKYVLTDLGRKVLEWAKERFPEIADVGFTARLEDMLDAVETGEEKWENVVRQVDEIIKKKLDREMAISR